ncbi:VOC family protein [Hahella ganghwensis]|uniref:VOC family protein n=1 Tax=Hahella ganghwensis TaxID=286420 RepID=UPI0003A81FB6|nr:VOC family protein [Hahella ganghwensis]
MKLNSYLIFNGQCREAFTFYAEVLNGTIDGMMAYAEAPPEPDSEQSDEGCGGDMTGHEDLIMHACLDLGGEKLMASDVSPENFQKPQGMHVAIQADSIEEAERIYAAMSQGAEIMMPLGETFWAKRFAMFTDRFGIPWMINYDKEM